MKLFERLTSDGWTEKGADEASGLSHLTSVEDTSEGIEVQAIVAGEEGNDSVVTVIPWHVIDKLLAARGRT